MSETTEPTIYEKALAKSHKTDGILVVDGKKLHVNKAVLSYHSDYFDALFNSNFKEKSMEEIPIEKVDFQGFATLLSLVHDDQLKITASKVVTLLELADRFQMNTTKSRIENFAIISTELPPFQKLFIGDKYKLNDLFDHAIGLYDNKAAFHDFHFSYLEVISNAARAKLFDKLVKSYE